MLRINKSRDLPHMHLASSLPKLEIAVNDANALLADKVRGQCARPSQGIEGHVGTAAAHRPRLEDPCQSLGQNFEISNFTPAPKHDNSISQ